MYSDYDACSVCGSEVRLLAHPGTAGDDAGRPAGPDDGVVGAGDDPVDVRECTNPDCPSHRDGGPTP
ncbi:hypothetical protein HN031_11840 [Nocardioides sp. zg-1308]|uniref:Small CPxCG-related zinc finger protein n=1 Tax=Nocardioides renjunii TaxID=3095075 RepID=A0ABU5KGW4_9ACTN|nr:MULTISPECIES: hypothetical protein [unclassified Nocardioides]MDZ5664202.1 hypothetical protein [Nocardioides sp. S-58]NPD05375.1 hypothetical protein [Nocardioides sp. zg-1308]WQQ23262.1 hypothetical protein SHK17_04610 [Nocardioides sp. S-34]